MNSRIGESIRRLSILELHIGILHAVRTCMHSYVRTSFQQAQICHILSSEAQQGFFTRNLTVLVTFFEDPYQYFVVAIAGVRASVLLCRHTVEEEVVMSPNSAPNLNLCG